MRVSALAEYHHGNLNMAVEGHGGGSSLCLRGYRQGTHRQGMKGVDVP